MKNWIGIVLLGWLGAVLAEEAENPPNWLDRSWETAQGWFKSQETPAEDARKQAFAAMWSNLTPVLDGLTELEEEQVELPDSAWFGRDKQSNLKDMDGLLDEAVSILGDGESLKIRADLRKLETRVREARAQIAEYRQKRIGAPVDHTWKTTVAEYDEKIQTQEHAITEFEQAIERQKQAFAAQMRAMGLALSREQLDVLLASVVGDDILRGGVVYANVKEVGRQLMQLSKESGEDLAVTRKYYGMHTVLLRSLLYMQKTFIQRIDQEYLPKIDGILQEVEALAAETQRLLAQSPNAAHRAHLQANQQAQALTRRTAELYRRHLASQKGKMQQAARQTHQDLEVARNTLHTVRVGGELVALLRTSQKSFDLLQNIQTPELLVFENLQMKQEFASLTARLRE